MIVNSDALSFLQVMEDESVHMGVTSPPYYGLRKYGTTPTIWGGDPNCQHEWGEVHPPGFRGTDTNPGKLQSGGNKNRQNLISDTCNKCGAWRGELGLEPTPELYVKHLVEIFRELKRVLRSDGTFWLNIGDSYWGGKGRSGGESPEHIADRDCISKEHHNIAGHGLMRPTDGTHPEIKPKDLIGIPWMLAFALRADGWYLRADLPWIKRNSMPSSVTDRPASSIEHVFLLSKSKKYYYDHIATMQPSSESYNNDKRPRGKIRQCVNPNSKYPDEGQFKKQDGTGNPTYTGFNDRWKAKNLMEKGQPVHSMHIARANGEGEVGGTNGLRFMRDSDFFFRTWQGLLHNEDGEPMALVVNPRGYKGAHFACFPIQLVEPMILAGTSEKGVCPVCGAPWKRIIKPRNNPSKEFNTGTDMTGGAAVTGNPQTSDGLHRNGGNAEGEPVETLGWQPTCKCGINPISADMRGLPALVLDPFAGSSATGVACKWHSRNFLGIELNPEYCKLGEQRIKDGK